MDKSTKKYFVELAWVMAAKVAVLVIIVGAFVLEHIYRGTAHRLWLDFISMLQ